MPQIATHAKEAKRPPLRLSDIRGMERGRKAEKREEERGALQLPFPACEGVSPRSVPRTPLRGVHRGGVGFLGRNAEALGGIVHPQEKSVGAGMNFEPGFRRVGNQRKLEFLVMPYAFPQPEVDIPMAGLFTEEVRQDRKSEIRRPASGVPPFHTGRRVVDHVAQGLAVDGDAQMPVQSADRGVDFVRLYVESVLMIYLLIQPIGLRNGYGNGNAVVPADFVDWRYPVEARLSDSVDAGLMGSMGMGARPSQKDRNRVSTGAGALRISRMV